MGDVVSTVAPIIADVAAVATGGALTPLAVAANLGAGVYDATQGNWLGAVGNTVGAGLGAGSVVGGLGGAAGAAGSAAGAAVPAAATTAADVASTAAPALGAGAGLSAAGLGAADALSYPLVSDVAAGSGDIFGLGAAPLANVGAGLGAGVDFGTGAAGAGGGSAAGGAAGAAAPASQTGPSAGLGANLGGAAGPSSGDLMGLPGGGGAGGLGGGAGLGGAASPAGGGGDLMGLPTGGTTAPSFSSQFTGAGPGDAAGFVSSPESVGFTGGATGIPAEGSTLFGIPFSDITKGLNVAGGIGGLAKQFLSPGVPNTGALKDLAGQIASSNAGLASAAQGFLNQGQALQAPLMSGAPLPTGAATQVDQALQGAEAAIRSRYASMGQSGSSAEQQALLAARQSAASQKFQIEQSLAQQGLSTAQTGASIAGGAQGGATTAANIYQQLIANAMGQDQALQGAIGRFASAVG